MSDRYDDGTGVGGLDVRELLEDASRSVRPGTVEPERTWEGGRRRRTRKRAGAGALGAASVVAVAGLVWQTGVFGGTSGQQEPQVATVPSGLTTFVLAAPGAPDVDPATISALRVPSADELSGTAWTLTDQLWGSEVSAADLVGADAETVFTFSDQGWGFLADGCGEGGAEGMVSLAADGTFDPPQLGTTDIGCPEPAQRAEDFWFGALQGGGSIHLLGSDWLLLSVDAAPAVGVGPAPVAVVEDGSRLSFVREGVDPDGAGGEARIPTQEELAGTRWQLVPGAADGQEAIEAELDDPAQLMLWFSEGDLGQGGLGQLDLVYGEGCRLATLQVSGLDDEGRVLSELGSSGVETTCAGSGSAAPMLVDSLSGRPRVVVRGDALDLYLPLPAVATTEEPAAATTQEPAAALVQEPVTTPTGQPLTMPSQEPAVPSTGETAEQPPTAPTQPTGPPAAEPQPPSPTDDPVVPSADVPGPDPAPAFRDPGAEWVDQPWPAAGGDLFAPTVRAGRHETFDRVVVDLTGSDDLGWRATYTDTPTYDGSGLPVAMAGDSFLWLTLTGMAYPEPGDPVYDGGDFGLDTHSLGGVVEVIRTTPFEGQLQVYVGLTGEPRPYRVFLLQDPMRLVIDVQQ